MTEEVRRAEMKVSASLRDGETATACRVWMRRLGEMTSRAGQVHDLHCASFASRELCHAVAVAQLDEVRR